MQIEEYATKHPHYWSGDFTNPELDFLLKNNSFQNVIDIGCGDGSLLYSLQKLGYLDHFNEIWAVDLSENRLSSVKMISEKIKTVQDNAQCLTNIPDNHFDLVISTQVIEHVNDDGEMIKSLSRICSRVIYLDTIFKKPYAWYFYKNMEGKWAIDPTHVREYMHESELLKKIPSNDFIVIFSKKNMLFFPILDFFIKRIGIKSKTIYANPIIKLLRKIKIPIIGYYCWKMVLLKK